MCYAKSGYGFKFDTVVLCIGLCRRTCHTSYSQLCQITALKIETLTKVCDTFGNSDGFQRSTAVKGGTAQFSQSFRKEHARLLPHIEKWIASDHVYTARFGIRMLMNEYLDRDFREEYPALVAAKKGDDYYLRMMIAWYFATALAKRYDEVIPYFEERRLDEWVHKKAIQKAVESFRVTEEHKAYLKSLR